MFAQTYKMHVNFKSLKIKSVYCFVTVTLIFVIFYLNNTSYLKKTEEVILIPSVTNRPFHETTTEGMRIHKVKPRSKTKYILLWTNPNTYPFVYFGEGNSIFTKKNCEYINCYVTSNRELLRDLTGYDIIAFNGPQLLDIVSLPQLRSFRQKYVYANIEAAANYPICTDNWNDFFNWTWTYKLNSDAVWGYIAIMDKNDNVIGPRVDMEWWSVDDMAPIDEALKKKLASKTKAGAWFVSNCNTLSKREVFVNEVQAYLIDYNLKIDVFGACGTFQCPKSIMPRCLDEVEKNYYFYFAFENAISEDYVTEKILYALDHYTVPVVYGGADYSRYLPPSSYLNAYELGAKNLAKEMYDIMENREIYYRYFRWRKYYTIKRRHEDPRTDEYCQFCAMANDEVLMTNQTIYKSLSSWWTPAGMCKNVNEK